MRPCVGVRPNRIRTASFHDARGANDVARVAGGLPARPPVSRAHDAPRRATTHAARAPPPLDGRPHSMSPSSPCDDMIEPIRLKTVRYDVTRVM